MVNYRGADEICDGCEYQLWVHEEEGEVDELLCECEGECPKVKDD